MGQYHLLRRIGSEFRADYNPRSAQLSERLDVEIHSSLKLLFPQLFTHPTRKRTNHSLNVSDSVDHIHGLVVDSRAPSFGLSQPVSQQLL